MVGGGSLSFRQDRDTSEKAEQETAVRKGPRSAVVARKLTPIEGCEAAMSAQRIAAVRQAQRGRRGTLRENESTGLQSWGLVDE